MFDVNFDIYHNSEVADSYIQTFVHFV